MLYIFFRNITFEDCALGLQDALKTLGICSTLCSDFIKPDTSDLYIIFGVNEFSGKLLPTNYIVYQLEQYVETAEWFNPKYISILKNAKAVMDYSFKNIMKLKQNNITNTYYTPFSYMAIHDTLNYENKDFEEIEKHKDIDVLFVGSINERRRAILDELIKRGLKVQTVVGGFWRGENFLSSTKHKHIGEHDDLRNETLKRTRIVINIHFYEKAILEIVRLSYFLSNKSFIITEPSSDPILDKEYRNYCVIGDGKKTSSSIADLCEYYVKHPQERLQKTIEFYTEFFKQPYYTILQKNADLLNRLKQFLGGEVKRMPTSQLDIIVPAHTNTDIFSAETTKEGGELVLKLMEIPTELLPKVSIVTPTYNRYKLFPIAIRNFLSFAEYYPKEKMEWIIIDDSETPPFVNELLPKDNRIKYVKIETTGRLPIGMKRNLCAKYATTNYIVHMDDDDYYFPHSVIARVKTLIKYGKNENSKDGCGYECVGSYELAIYNLLENYGYVQRNNSFGEATIAYTKKFWEEHKYDEQDSNYGEGISFMNGRRHKLINIPYVFNMIAINHGGNVTGNHRLQNMLPEKNNKILELLEPETKDFLLKMRLRILL